MLKQWSLVADTLNITREGKEKVKYRNIDILQCYFFGCVWVCLTHSFLFLLNLHNKAHILTLMCWLRCCARETMVQISV